MSNYRVVALEASFLVAAEEFQAVVASYLQLVQQVDYPGKLVPDEEDYADTWATEPFSLPKMRTDKHNTL